MSSHERPFGTDGLRVEQALLTGQFTVRGQIVESSNGALLGEVTHEGDTIRAIYKPRDFERALRDFPAGLERRELLAYRLSAYLTGCNIPPIVVRNDLPFGLGSLQAFIDADFSKHYFDFLEIPALRPQLIAFAIFDLIANNADRKATHLLLDPQTDQIYGIDNALCFHPHPKVRTVIWDFGGMLLPATQSAEVARLAEDLPADMADLMSPAETTAFRIRCEWLLQEGMLPEIPEDRRPYPWPIF